MGIRTCFAHATAAKSKRAPDTQPSRWSLFWLQIVESSTLVELRGQLSNPSSRELVDLVDLRLRRPAPADDACHPALSPARQVRIRDRLDVEELVRRFANGAMIKELAQEYSISESSVKRLLREQGAKRYWVTD